MHYSLLITHYWKLIIFIHHPCDRKYLLIPGILCSSFHKLIEMEIGDDVVEEPIQGRFDLVQKIGNGAYGHVWKVLEKRSGETYALKKIFSAFQNDADAQRTYREIAILKSLNHPNVIKLKEVIRAANEKDLYLLFEYLECDLFTAIRGGILKENHKRFIISQLIEAIHYLHSACIVHRDLKPSNILIDSKCRIKICDFGLSRTLYHQDHKRPKMTEFMATRWYRAPEILFGGIDYGFKSDLWSLGCIIYEIYTGCPLLPGQDTVDQIQKMIEFKGLPNCQEIQHLQVFRLQTLLSHFEVVEKKDEDLYFSPLSWNPNLIHLIKNLLEYSPKKRWGITEAYNSPLLDKYRREQKLITSDKAVHLRLADHRKFQIQDYRSIIYKYFTKNTQTLKCTHFQSGLPLKEKRESLRYKSLFRYSSLSIRKAARKQNHSVHTRFVRDSGRKIQNRRKNDFRGRKSLQSFDSLPKKIRNKQSSPYFKTLKKTTSNNLIYCRKKSPKRKLEKVVCRQQSAKSVKRTLKINKE